MFIQELIINDVWQYSHYYADMISTSNRLYNSEEYYAAVLILLNATELIFKSVRENFNENFNQDIKHLKEQNILTEEEYNFISSKQFGVREIRNIITHRDVYQHCMEDSNGNACLFSDSGTWRLVYENYSPRLIGIINRITKQVGIDKNDADKRKSEV